MTITAEELTKLADTAFTGKNNATARGALIKAIGEAHTRDIGSRYKITDIFSLREKGTKPAALELDLYLSEAEALQHDAKAAELKERLHGKPLHASMATSESNGWSNCARNVDADGNWTPRALKLQADTLRLGPKVAAGVAAAAGSSVGAKFPPKAKVKAGVA